MDSEYVSDQENTNIIRLVAGGILNHNSIFTELGLRINFEIGEYYIVDQKQWMLGKIKYGI